MSNKGKIFLITFVVIFFGAFFYCLWSIDQAEALRLQNMSPAEKQKISAIAEQLKTMERGDFLILNPLKGESPRIAFITSIGGNPKFIFYMGDSETTAGRKSLSLYVNRVVKKTDPDAPAIALKFLQQ